jgi:hypothetical protein
MNSFKSAILERRSSKNDEFAKKTSHSKTAASEHHLEKKL